LINLLVKVFVDLDLVGIVLVGVVDADCCLRLRVS
jgi:predicted PilT family ATPase